MSKPRSLNQLLATPVIAELLTNVHRLESLTKDVRHCLPADLAPHVQAVAFRDARLVIQTESSAWATRLRYSTPTALQCLRAMPVFRDLADIEVHIAPAAAVPATTTNPTKLSLHGAAAIRGASATVSDEALAAALERLARRGSKR